MVHPTGKTNAKKISIVGAGNVGATTALRLAEFGSVDVARPLTGTAALPSAELVVQGAYGAVDTGSGCSHIRKCHVKASKGKRRK